MIERMKKTGWYLIQEIHEYSDGGYLLRDAFISEDSHKESREALAEDGSNGMGFEVLTCVEVSAGMLPLYQQFRTGSLASRRYRNSLIENRQIHKVFTQNP